MLITPRKPRGELRYVLQAQRALKPQQQIVWRSRCLTLDERAATADLTAFDSAGRLVPRSGSANVLALRSALQRIEFGSEIAKDWLAAVQGALDAADAPRGAKVTTTDVQALEGQQMPDCVLDLFDGPALGEVGRAIREESQVSEDQEGNSEPQSD